MTRWSYERDSGSIRRGSNASPLDRKSTRLNSSHVAISYAVFCLKKKNSNSSGSSSKLEGEDGNNAIYEALNGKRSVDGRSTLNPSHRACVERSKLKHEFSPTFNPPE